MSRRIPVLQTAALAATVLLLPFAALAFNPQPDPPGTLVKQTTALGGPDTKSAKRQFLAPNGIIILDKRGAAKKGAANADRRMG